MNYDNIGTANIASRTGGLSPALSKFDGFVEDIHQLISKLEQKTELLHKTGLQKETDMSHPSSASNKIEITLEHIQTRLSDLSNKL